MRICSACGDTADDESSDIQSISIFYIHHIDTCRACLNKWERINRRDPNCRRWRDLQSRREVLMAAAGAGGSMAELMELAEAHAAASAEQDALEILIADTAAQFFNYHADE